MPIYSISDLGGPASSGSRGFPGHRSLTERAQISDVSRMRNTIMRSPDTTRGTRQIPAESASWVSPPTDQDEPDLALGTPFDLPHPCLGPAIRAKKSGLDFRTDGRAKARMDHRRWPPGSPVGEFEANGLFLVCASRLSVVKADREGETAGGRGSCRAAGARERRPWLAARQEPRPPDTSPKPLTDSRDAHTFFSGEGWHPWKTGWSGVTIGGL